MKMSKTEAQRAFWAAIAWCASYVTAPEFMDRLAGLELSEPATWAISVVVGVLALFMQDQNHNGTPDILEGPNA